MGKLNGDLDIVGLEHLFQTLALNRREGVLTLSRGTERKSLFLGNDGIRFLSLGKQRANMLGEILIRTKKITQVQLTELLQEQKKRGERLGEVVIRARIVSKEDIESALKEQFTEEVYELFTWEKASFEFTEMKLKDASFDDPISYIALTEDITSLILESARRADELLMIRKVIKDEDAVLTKTETTPDLSHENIDVEVVQAILALIDNTRTIRQVVEESLYPRFQVLRALYVLLTHQVIKAKNIEGGTTIRIEQSHTSESGDDKSKKVILLICDMLNFRNILSQDLRKSGYEVVEASSTMNLPLLYRAHRIEGAILDISIHSVDGLSRCKEMSYTHKIPVMVLSSNRSKEAIIGAARYGAREYMVKPFRQEMLLEKLKKMLSPA